MSDLHPVGGAKGGTETAPHLDEHEALWQAIGDGLCVLGAGGEILRLNDAGKALLGSPGDDRLLGASIFDLIDQASGDFAARLVQALAGLGDADLVCTELGWLRRQVGPAIPVSLSLNRVATQTPRYVLMFRDATARERSEAALRHARDAAEAANIAKSQFLAMMSHEIRTPMNGVLGMNELLLGTALDARQRAFAEQIRRSGETLLGIINDILDFSKIEAGKLELQATLIDLHELVDDVVGPLAELGRAKGVAITCETGEGLPRHLIGDPVRLRQVLFNLVGNALKFTGTDGRVRVHVAADPPADTSGRRRLRFEVADTGVGIAADAQRALFRPFMQAEVGGTRKFGGTGLGLAIVKRLIELMDGSIEVASQPGIGTTFRFELVLAAGGDDSARLKPSAGTDRGGFADVRVLVAEDNPVNQMIVALMLEDMGCDVTLTDDGRQALRAYAKGRFDILLVDCQMPELDGFGLVRSIRERDGISAPPLIAYTANALSEDRAACLAAGFDDHLPKPVTADALAATLARWRGEQGLAETGFASATSFSTTAGSIPL